MSRFNYFLETIKLENEIWKAQMNKEMVTGVFFDIEKAYD